jgi:hypothetical protein
MFSPPFVTGALSAKKSKNPLLSGFFVVWCFEDPSLLARI